MRHSIWPRTLLAAFLLGTTLAACDAITGRETAGEYVDDATISTKVRAAILQESDLRGEGISVETFKQVVQLSGFVDSQADARKAGEIARKVEGVQSVKNDLRVRQ